ncbi:hypothetical protein [Streptomyces sp. RKND-216]|nr:hypothetical protein [Streptomyces sp. RKND-216]
MTPPADGEHEEIVSELTGKVRDQRRKLGATPASG